MTIKPVFDVVVVGAGLSGLQAAHVVKSAGLSVCVLEATDRVGGKTLTMQSTERGFNDLGAAWINDTSQSEMFKLYQRYGMEAEVQRAYGYDVTSLADGSVIQTPYGQSVGDTQLFEALLDLLRTEASKVDLDHPRNSADAEKIDLLTFRDFCVQRTKTSDVSELADEICAALLGVESDEVSALFMLHYFKSGTGIDNLLSDQKNGGQYLRNRQGMIGWSSKPICSVANGSGNQTISKRLSEELGPKTVNLRAPVVSIDQSQKDKCVVTTSSGEATHCRKVIVSIPTTLYHTITFNPALPPEKVIMSESAVMGYYSKAIFVFKEPWWQKFELSGILNTDHGPIRFTRDTSIPADDQWSITCFIVGERGRAWSKLSKMARYGVVWDQFRHAFEQALASQMRDKIPTPSKYLEMEWSKQAFFLGAPCPVMTPGTLIAFGESLTKPAENIHFVGTETSNVWRGYMEGAVRSGQRGGTEVVKELKQTWELKLQGGGLR